MKRIFVAVKQDQLIGVIDMITLVRSEYNYATLSASEAEWDAIQAILDAAARKYAETELDTFLSGSPETRRQRVSRLAEYFSVLDRLSDDLSREHIRDMMIIIDTMECITVEGVDRSVHQDITDQFGRFPPVSELFGDD